MHLFSFEMNQNFGLDYLLVNHICKDFAVTFLQIAVKPYIQISGSVVFLTAAAVCLNTVPPLPDLNSAILK